MDDHKDGGTFLRNIALGLIVCIVFLTLPSLCGAHSHDGSDHHGHSHDDVPPSFKYSRQANEDILKKAAHYHHDHAHAGHGHGDHKHNHDGLQHHVELGKVFTFIFLYETG